MDRFWLGLVVGFGLACALNGMVSQPQQCATVPELRRELIDVVPTACRLAATEAFKTMFVNDQGKAYGDGK
jgi:hypothetical protein